MPDDLDSEFAAAGSAVAEGKKAVDDRIRGQQADDRSVIAKLIVWSFGAIGSAQLSRPLPESALLARTTEAYRSTVASARTENVIQ
jgi:hypothetical protein